MTDLQTDIAIVGAGLAGLALARGLVDRGCDVLLLEARARVGGRILSPPERQGATARFDMGPAWIWPHNARMLKLAADLGLSIIPQHAHGKLVFQDQNGVIRRDLDFATMGDALRVSGGLAQIPEALADTLPAGVLRLGHAVSSAEATPRNIALHGDTPDGALRVSARKVVLALPPRLAAATITFTPRLSVATQKQLSAVPTWMAGQAKFVATYGEPFWRKQGLSGDAISHTGPLVEVHDASAETEHAQGNALFGFVHPAALRPEIDEARLTTMALTQLAALFGDAAGSPHTTHLKIWLQDGHTATSADLHAPAGHPSYRPLEFPDDPWRGVVHISGSETARHDGGFLEGALESAEHTLAAPLAD